MKLLILSLLGLILTAAGCTHTYGGEDPFAQEGRPFYGERPAYFDQAQPGLGSRGNDN